jgi:hypothetical protein
LVYHRCLKQTYITLNDVSEEDNKKKKQAKAKQENGDIPKVETNKQKCEIATLKLKKIHLYADGLKKIISHFPKTDQGNTNYRS